MAAYNDPNANTITLFGETYPKPDAIDDQQWAFLKFIAEGKIWEVAGFHGAIFVGEGFAFLTSAFVLALPRASLRSALDYNGPYVNPIAAATDPIEKSMFVHFMGTWTLFTGSVCAFIPGLITMAFPPVATAYAATAYYPAQMLAMRLKSQDWSDYVDAPIHNGFFDGCSKVMKNEGTLALWNGWAAMTAHNTLLTASASLIDYHIVSKIIDSQGKNDNIAEMFTPYGLAKVSVRTGIVNGLLAAALTPLYTIGAVQACDLSGRYSGFDGPLVAFKDITAQDGVKALYHAAPSRALEGGFLSAGITGVFGALDYVGNLVLGQR